MDSQGQSAEACACAAVVASPTGRQHPSAPQRHQRRPWQQQQQRHRQRLTMLMLLASSPAQNCSVHQEAPTPAALTRGNAFT